MWFKQRPTPVTTVTFLLCHIPSWPWTPFTHSRQAFHLALSSGHPPSHVTLCGVVMPLALWPTVKLDHSKRNPGGPRGRWWREKKVRDDDPLCAEALWPCRECPGRQPPGNLHSLLGEAVTGDIIDLFVLLAGVWGDPALPKGRLPWPQERLRGGVSHSSPPYWVHIRLDYFLISPSQLSIAFIQHRLACPRLESLNWDSSFLTKDRLVL